MDLSLRAASANFFHDYTVSPIPHSLSWRQRKRLREKTFDDLYVFLSNYSELISSNASQLSARDLHDFIYASQRPREECTSTLKLRIFF